MTIGELKARIQAIPDALPVVVRGVRLRSRGRFDRHGVSAERAYNPVMLQTNARVRISGKAGIVIGRIEDLRTVDEMPDLPELGLPVAGEWAPKNILRERGVERVAAISYHYTPHSEVMFWALAVGDKWYDLQGEELTLEIVGACS